MSNHRDIKTRTLFLVGFLTIGIVTVLTLAMMVLYQRMANRLEYERMTSRPNPEVEQMVKDQRRQLNEYGVVGTEEVGDETRTIYRIPIDVAMKKVLSEWQEGVEPREPFADTENASAETSPAAAPEPKARSGEVSEEGSDVQPQ